MRIKKISFLLLVMASLSLYSCRTGCGCPMAETERGFQVAPKSSFPTHEFIRGIDHVSHRVQSDFIVVVVKETVLTQVVS